MTENIKQKARTGREGRGAPVSPPMPDWNDLRAKIRFAPADGRIWLDDQRMVLMHLSSLTSLRRELIDTLGVDRARGILTRMGYEAGARDARIARKVRPSANYFDILAVGPQLHALEGVVAVDPIRVEIDVSKGICLAEFLWRDSSEVDSHVSLYGGSAEPVCWTQIGYACGYTSAFMGKQILFRETQCRAMGHTACRILGKPVEEWDNPEDDMRYLMPDSAIRADTPSPSLSVRTAFANGSELGKQLVGVSSGFIATCHMIEKVASTTATVLFLGETGVGKEMFARTLHGVSKRGQKPFVAINCAAIPENLVESELFGVEKGAFTGAVQSRPGRFERADGGTLFLDEIGTLNMAAQGKLLRALQEKEIERIGDVRSRKVDVRVLAATNVDLQAEVKAGRFREDLLFRLNVFPIRIPPLRERRDDIPVLMAYFLNRFAQQHERDVTGFTERAVEALLEYDYPGNIRELENMVERAVILAGEGGALDISHLFSGEAAYRSRTLHIERSELRGAEDSGASPHMADLIDQMLEGGTNMEALERRLIKQAVEKAGGNLAQAARMLGMTRPQLAYRFSKLDEG